MRPVVDACMFLRRSAFFFIPYESNFYMISYRALFYTSFLYHAIKTPEYFGRLIISALLLQVFGTLAYLVAPAVGPFIYERSEEHTSELQSLMRISYAVFCLKKKTTNK